MFDAEHILAKGFALFLPATLQLTASITPLSLVGVSCHTVPAPVTPVPLRGLDHQAAFAARIGVAGTTTSTSPVATS
jgi:hypothetical protein